MKYFLMRRYLLKFMIRKMLYGQKYFFKNIFIRKTAEPFVNYLKKWDQIASKRPDVMIAISSVVQQRIKKYYGRDSEIIFPPVNVKKIRKEKTKKKYYLVVSRLVG